MDSFELNLLEKKIKIMTIVVKMNNSYITQIGKVDKFMDLSENDPDFKAEYNEKLAFWAKMTEGESPEEIRKIMERAALFEVIAEAIVENQP